MGIFGKNRGGDPGAGLGRGVALDEGDAVVLDKSASASEVIVEPARPGTVSEAERIVSDLSAGKPTRAEKRAAAAEAKKRKLEDRAAAKAAKAAGLPAPAAQGVDAKKSRKALKAEREAEEALKDNHRLSNMVMIDFYPGMAKEDAIETARHWAMTHMDMPSMCFYHIMKIRDGYAIEVQEGVGKAYLPSVIELAQANPGRLIIVPMIRRKLSVFYSARLGEFNSEVLPELQEPPAMPENPPMTAVRGPAMTPVMKQYREWLVAGIATAAIGGVALLSSLAFYAFDPGARVPPEWRTTDVAQLPVMQWGRLQADSTESFVSRLEFADGQWRIVRQAVGASVDVATPDATASGSAIVGGAVPDASPTGSPGMPQQGPVGAPPTTIPPTGSPATIPPPSGVPNS